MVGGLEDVLVEWPLQTEVLVTCREFLQVTWRETEETGTGLE